MSLKEINPRLASIYEPLENFCSCDDGNFDKGSALKHKITKRIYCFKDYDVWRGRGNYSECKGLECKYYYYVNPKQTKFTKFVDFNSQYPQKEKL